MFGLVPTGAKTGIVVLCALQGVAQFCSAAGEIDVHFLLTPSANGWVFVDVLRPSVQNLGSRLDVATSAT